MRRKPAYPPGKPDGLAARSLPVACVVLDMSCEDAKSDLRPAHIGTTPMTDLDLSADIIATRNIMDRVDELLALVPSDETEDGAEPDAPMDPDDVTELAELQTILAELCGEGGDEQWEGDWYPAHLIHEHHFQDYAQELAEDCGMIPDNAKWPMTCIDWEQAARELQMDYTSTDIGTHTYYFR